MPNKPAIFLDRDGTINVEKHYLHHREDWEWIPGAPESIKRLHDAGYRVIIVSNQSGIARGMFTAADVDALHNFINAALAEYDARIDAFYYCPHAPEEGCACRKPAPGMLLTAAHEHGIDLTCSFMVGDKIGDMEAATRAGVEPLMVRTGHGQAEAENHRYTGTIVEDINAAAAHILQRTTS